MTLYWSEKIRAMPAKSIAEIDARTRAIIYATECGTCGADLTEPTEDGIPLTANSDLCGKCVQAIKTAEIAAWIERENSAAIRRRLRKRKGLA